MAEQYDISPEKRKILEENTKRRAQLRNYFLKEAHNPFTHAKGEGGAVFDPAIYRYNAMRVSSYEHFKPTAPNAAFGFFLVVLPIIGYGYYLVSSRRKREARFRNGEVAYKDRMFKLI